MLKYFHQYYGLGMSQINLVYGGFMFISSLIYILIAYCICGIQILGLKVLRNKISFANGKVQSIFKA